MGEGNRRTMIDINRAKSIGLGYVTQWVPGGKTEGNEYKVLNPARADRKIGSFSINLQTGKWADFADFNEARGGDAVSLYAYLNRSSLKGSTEGQIQIEAAKEILRIYDGQTFDDAPAFVKKEKGRWAGYRQIPGGVDNPPELDVKWAEDQWGKKERVWDFKNSRGKIVLKIVRFRNEKKSDRPFTLWTNGEKTEWRAKNLECKNPLYNLLGLQEKEELPVLLTEGQKNAEDSREILLPHFVTTSVYRSPDMTELEPLRGREVYIWGDPDGSGRKKASILKDKLLNLDCRIHMVHSPSGKAKWDISDAIQEGWTVSQLKEHIESFPVVGATIKEEVYLDDIIEDMPFKVFAISGEYIYIYSSRFRQELKFKMTALNKNSLITIMPRSTWEKYFMGEKAINWDGAVDLILEMAEDAPLYDSSLVRGSGLWRDQGGKFVCSTGNGLILDNKICDLMSFDSKFVYKRSQYVPYTTENPMSKEESLKIMDIFNNISFESEMSSAFLAGWAFLAPFCGSLIWRPHIWLNGPAGSGKSTVQRYVNMLLKNFSKKVAADGSTEPGIRQELNNCALPVTLDEMEAVNAKTKDNIQALLGMARQASSGGMEQPRILKGSSDQQGQSFSVNSMFFFASILDSIELTADMDRIEVLTLRDPSMIDMAKNQEQFESLKRMVEDIITPDFSERFYSRGLNIFEETLKAIDIFIKVSAKVLETQRGGDQKGTLLAGCYMISHDVAPTEEEAIEWAKKFDIKKAREDHLIKQDYETCLEILLSQQVEGPNRKRQSVASWYEDYQELILDLDQKEIIKALSPHGFRFEKGCIDIATNFSPVKKILKDSPWENNYSKLLRRHPDYVKDQSKVRRFAGLNSGSVRIKIYEECPF